MSRCLVRTDRLQLREMALSDISFISEYAKDQELMRYLMVWLDSDEKISSFVTQAVDGAQSADRKEYILSAETHDREFVGTALIAIDHESSTTAEIGYIIRKPMWGKGFATEIARSLIAYCFNDLSMHRVFAKCDELNQPSARILEKCRMRFEGVQREHVWLRDHWRTSRIYGILHGEFASGTQ